VISRNFKGGKVRENKGSGRGRRTGVRKEGEEPEEEEEAMGDVGSEQLHAG